MRRTRATLGAGAAALLLLTGCSAAHATTEHASASPSTLASPSSGPTHSSRSTLHVVGLGDSVMAGTNCGCDGIVEEYADALASRTGSTVRRTDLSAGGLVTGDVDDGLRTDTSQQRALRAADVVLITIGANDLYPALDRWKASSCDSSCYHAVTATMGRHLSGVLDRVESLVGPRTQVLVTNYWNVFTDGAMTRRAAGQAQIDFSEDVTDAANTEICRAARAHSATCVDLLVPFKGTEAAPQDPTPLLAPDGDHPDARGVQVIVQALLRATRTP